MSQLKNTPLPLASPEYDVSNEARTRRELEFSLQAISNELDVAKTQADKPGSLAMRRFQFLLMGAS